jgi:hypothetical protein
LKRFSNKRIPKKKTLEWLGHGSSKKHDSCGPDLTLSGTNRRSFGSTLPRFASTLSRSAPPTDLLFPFKNQKSAIVIHQFSPSMLGVRYSILKVPFLPKAPAFSQIFDFPPAAFPLASAL